MSLHNPKFFRQRRLCYWDSDPKRFGSAKAQIERQLTYLPQMTVHSLTSLDDPEFFPCDLLIAFAGQIPDDELYTWIEGLKKRIQRQGKIWTPALILSSVGFADLSSWLHEYAESNWYFDILNPDHIASLPIRVANLLRIHDHLHELNRYYDQLTTMQEKIATIEQDLDDLRSKDGNDEPD
jgi:hypothetical protein